MHALSAPDVTPGLARLARLRWDARRAGLLALPAVLSIVLAIGLAWFIDGRVTELMLAQAASRAVDHVRLGVLDLVTAEDLGEPHTPDKLDALASRMGPAVDRMRQAGSGLIRINVIARDGTVLYSDDAAKRGQVVPFTKEDFVRALSGQVGREESNLSTPENADLKSRYHDALEVYVPLLINGRVAGVYEMYQDTGPMRTLRVLLWSVVVVFSVGLCVLGFKRRAAVLPARPRPALNVGLTPRELDVLRLMTTSHTYRDIAERLVISEETVRTHVKSILRKLGQPDSTRAVVAAVKAGIVEVL